MPRNGPATEHEQDSLASQSAAPTAAGGTDPLAAVPPAGCQAPASLATAVAIAGGFLALLDTTIVNVSLADTAARFGALGKVQWIVTAYLIALAAVMPATGWLTARFGVTRLLLSATALFTLGSTGCALSQNLPELIAARSLSGAAAGILIPASTILLTRGVPRDRLGRVQALNGSMMLISPLLGPTIGGLLVHAWGWPAVYAVNIPLCTLLFCATLRWVAKDRVGHSARPLDVTGLLSAAACTVSSVIAIHEFAGHGLKPSAALLLPLATALASGAVFTVHERRTPHPLTDLSLLGNRVYRTALINVFCLGFVLYSPMMLIPLYFQDAREETTVTTGLLMSTAGIGVIAAGLLCQRLAKRLGVGPTVIVGIALTIIATLPLTGLSDSTPYPLLCASLAVRGLGTGLTIVPTMTRAFQSIRTESIGDASAQLNLAQRIGGAVAIAVVTVVLTQAAERHHGLVAGAFAESFTWLTGAYAVTLLPAVALLLADRNQARQAAAKGSVGTV